VGRSKTVTVDEWDKLLAMDGNRGMSPTFLLYGFSVKARVHVFCGGGGGDDGRTDDDESRGERSDERKNGECYESFGDVHGILLGLLEMQIAWYVSLNDESGHLPSG